MNLFVRTQTRPHPCVDCSVPAPETGNERNAVTEVFHWIVMWFVRLFVYLNRWHVGKGYWRALTPSRAQLKSGVPRKVPSGRFDTKEHWISFSILVFVFCLSVCLSQLVADIDRYFESRTLSPLSLIYGGRRLPQEWQLSESFTACRELMPACGRLCAQFKGLCLQLPMLHKCPMLILLKNK